MLLSQARTGHRILSAVCRSLSTSSSRNMPIKVGEKIPSVELMEGTPGNKVNMADLLANKKAVVFAVPGAFTPGCSKTHLPGYVEDFDTIKAKGVDLVVCVSVNDPFVMSAWGEAHGTEGKIRMLADTLGEFTKAVDMELDAKAFLGNIRSKRYALVVENGVVSQVQLEPDGTGLTCSLSNSLLSSL
ncbi:peroxiredoxin-5, mitochondrial-like [Acanthaster planci]|uniref:Peroxiredoxin-5 n=1 Tax=Acanthaster planci TaxID=133434 RepID=A0A8B7YBF9_ACAPL|nr:peroxiredoxin-5, mitochondrial-like [Acanthaster planci]